MTLIAIDARFYGSGHTGLGRYTTNVLKYLPNHLTAPAGLRGETLQVLLRDTEYDNFQGGKNVQKIRAEIPHYSLAEQIELPLLLNKLKPDLFYTFHFNTPIFSRLPTIVTVHDLIKSHFTGTDTTTRAPWLYGLKRLGYNRVIKQTLMHASDIIVPTNTVKNDILALFNEVKPERIHPIPEAPDSVFRQKNSNHQTPIIKLPGNYILFVGNAYPHKNLSLLLEAMKKLPELDLVIVSKPSPFLDRTLAPYNRKRLHVLSNLSDAELSSLYKGAQVLVTPSLMEGFGLVGLEALMVGTPVVASNIPVHREVYGDKITYFDPHSVADLVRVLSSPKYFLPKTKFRFNRTWDDVARDIAEVIHARCARL